MVRILAVLGLVLSVPAWGQQSPVHTLLVADSGLNKLLLFGPDGKVIWEHDATSCFDATLLPNGNVLFCECTKERSAVREVTREHKVVFSYETEGEVFSCQRLGNGHTLIGCCTAGKLLEVTSGGTVVRTITLKSETQGHALMRLMRATPWKTYLVAHMGDKVVREYNAKSEVVREIKTEAAAFGVAPLKNKNILVSSQTAVFEIAPDGKKVWELADKDIPEAGPAWLTGMHRLPNGNTLISNWLGHGKEGSGCPVFEVTPDKKIAWKFTDTQQTKWVASAQYAD